MLQLSRRSLCHLTSCLQGKRTNALKTGKGVKRWNGEFPAGMNKISVYLSGGWAFTLYIRCDCVCFRSSVAALLLLQVFITYSPKARTQPGSLRWRPSPSSTSAPGPCKSLSEVTTVCPYEVPALSVTADEPAQS